MPFLNVSHMRGLHENGVPDQLPQLSVRTPRDADRNQPLLIGPFHSSNDVGRTATAAKADQ